MDISISLNNISRQTRDDLVAALTDAMQAAREMSLHYMGLSRSFVTDGQRRTYVAECDRYEAKVNALRQMCIAISTAKSEPDYTTEVSPAWVGQLSHCWSDGRMITNGDLGQS